MQNFRWSPCAEYTINAKKYICYKNIVSEIIYGRLYFLTAITTPHSTQETHFFNIDDELIYERYYEDFGPLNLGQVYRFCCKLNKKFKSASLNKKKIVFYTNGHQPEKRANGAFLIGAYQVIYLKKTPEEAYMPLVEDGPIFKPFRDASYGESVYDLTVLDCLKGLAKAISNGFVDFSKFNLVEYEHHMRIDRGDLTWIVPSKIIAFSCPQEDAKATINGIRMFSPTDYLGVFKRYHVTDVVRLNKAVYDKRQFTRAGIRHHDLYFPDGTTPSDIILRRFLQLCETATGAIAVHCKAGLGRTGSLIGCYLMKHHRFSCQEAIAWLRICRPGSVIGMQQMWLDEKQAWCWMQGDMFRRRRTSTSTPTSRKSSLMYSPEADGEVLQDAVDVGRSRRYPRTDLDAWNSYEDSHPTTNGYVEQQLEETQGDRLNRVKLRRSAECRQNGEEVENIVPRRNSRSSHPEVRPRARSSSPMANGTSLHGSLVRSGSASSLRGSTKDLTATVNGSPPRRSSSTYNLSSSSRGEDAASLSSSLRRSNGRFILTSPTRSSTAPTFSSTMGKKPPLPQNSHSTALRQSGGVNISSRRSGSVASGKARPTFSTYQFGGRLSNTAASYNNLRDTPTLRSSVSSANRHSSAELNEANDDRTYNSSTFPRSKSAKVRRTPLREGFAINGSALHQRTTSNRVKSAVDGELAQSRRNRGYTLDKRHDSGKSYLSKSYGDLLHAYNYERSTPVSRFSNGVNGYGSVRSSYSFY